MTERREAARHGYAHRLSLEHLVFAVTTASTGKNDDESGAHPRAG